MVSPELRIGTFERGITVGLRLFDAIMENSRQLQRMGIVRDQDSGRGRGDARLTRSCGPSSIDCAGRNSLTLKKLSQ
jgi:hypothetical protein